MQVGSEESSLKNINETGNNLNEEEDVTESEMISSQYDKSREILTKSEEKDELLRLFNSRRKIKLEGPDLEEDMFEDPLALFSRVMKESAIDDETKLDLYLCTTLFALHLLTIRR